MELVAQATHPIGLAEDHLVVLHCEELDHCQSHSKEASFAVVAGKVAPR